MCELASRRSIVFQYHELERYSAETEPGYRVLKIALLVLIYVRTHKKVNGGEFSASDNGHLLSLQHVRCLVFFLGYVKISGTNVF
jgi:hypothetical protein